MPKIEVLGVIVTPRFIMFFIFEVRSKSWVLLAPSGKHTIVIDDIPVAVVDCQDVVHVRVPQIVSTIICLVICAEIIEPFVPDRN